MCPDGPAVGFPKHSRPDTTNAADKPWILHSEDIAPLGRAGTWVMVDWGHCGWRCCEDGLFPKHPMLISTQRWPKSDIDNRSLINLYSSSSQSFPLFSACLLARIFSWERYSTSWPCGTLSKHKIEHAVESRWKANRACIWIQPVWRHLEN